jgi:hypothetical protein
MSFLFPPFFWGKSTRNLIFPSFYVIIIPEKIKERLEMKTSAPTRPTWVGYYTRKTKTKKEKLNSIERKHKNKMED